MKILPALTATALALLALPARATPPLPAWAEPLDRFCMSVARSAAYIAEKRDEGYYEQTLMALLPAEDGSHFVHDARQNVALIFHDYTWLQVNPPTAGAYAYDRCVTYHGNETWWRVPPSVLAGAQ